MSIAIPQPGGVPDALDLIRSSDDRVMDNAAAGRERYEQEEDHRADQTRETRRRQPARSR